MGRPILVVALSLSAGILTASIVHSFFFILLIITIIIFFAILIVHKSNGVKLVVILSLLFFMAGAFQYLYLEYRGERLYQEYYGREICIEGYVCSDADIRDERVIYQVKTKIISSDKDQKYINGKIQLTILKSGSFVPPEYGCHIKVRGCLERPAYKRNPGGFNYWRYLASKGIYGTIFARSDSLVLSGEDRGNPLIRYGLAVRKHIVDIIKNSLPSQQAGLLNGMLIGYRKDLTDEVQQAFTDSGLIHIMAVSGANIAFIIFPFAFIFKKLKIRKRVSNVIIIFVLVLFVFITGFSASVLRAAIMAIVVLIGQIIRRESDVIAGLSVAAIFLLLLNPYNLFDIGFQLSFAATLSLILFCGNVSKMMRNKYIPPFITNTLAVTISAQAGVLPISAYYFNNISTISPLTNLLAAPLLEIITVLGTLMALIGSFNIVISRLIGYINCFFLSALLYITKISSSFSFSVIKVATPDIVVIIAYYALVMILLWYAPKGRIKIRFVYILSFCCIVLAAVFISLIIPKPLEVVFIDVGKGDAILIKTSKGKAILIDGGGKSLAFGEQSSSEKNDGADIGEKVVIPFILDYGITKLDIVIATHDHDDHLQGLLPVLEEFRVDNFIYSSNYGGGFSKALEICQKRKIKTYNCHAGDSINIDNRTSIKIIYPKDKFLTPQGSSNNSSLVMKLVFGRTEILFTGDIEKEIEQELIKSGEDIAAQVLKVAHHGSSSSSCAEFIEKVNPGVAVISVGQNNFGHPSEEVLDRFEERMIKVFRTDRDGAVILKSNGRKIKVYTEVSSAK